MERMRNQGSRPDQYPRVRGAAFQGVRESGRIFDFDGVDREARGHDGIGEADRGRPLVGGMDDRNVGQVSLPKGE
jgi:hypothetical protein